MSQQALMAVQIGKETTWNTAVPATAKLMGLTKSPEFQHAAEVEVLEEVRGSMAPGFLAVLNAIGATAKIPGYVLYEDWPYWMDGLFGEVAATGGPAYVYAHTAPLGTAPASVRKFSIEHGDKVAGGPNYVMSGGIVQKLTVKGESKKALTYNAELVGGKQATVTLATLSDRTVEPVHGAQVVVYVDAWAGTMGSTALTATAFAFEYTIDARRNLGYFFGSLPPLDWDEDFFDVMLKMTLKFNATSKAYVDEIIGTSVSQRQIRLKATSGTKIWQQDFAGTFIEAPKMWDVRNGAIVVNFSLKGTYHSTFANYFKSSVTNAVATLP